MSNKQYVSLVPLVDRLRTHALGPPVCQQCGQHRDSKEWSKCRLEYQCDFNRKYGLSTTGGVDIFAAKRDMTEAADALDEHGMLFDLRWKADMRAIKRWQAANPGNDLVWPDHADLVVWLLDQLDGLRLAKENRDGA